MSLILTILGVVSFVLLGGYTALLARKVSAIDSDTHKAFAYVGDHIGDLIVRADRVEQQVGYLVSSRDATDNGAKEGIDVFVVLDDAEKWAKDSVIPTILGVDFAAEDTAPLQFTLPMIEGGRSLPNSFGY